MSAKPQIISYRGGIIIRLTRASKDNSNTNTTKALAASSSPFSAVGADIAKHGVARCNR